MLFTTTETKAKMSPDLGQIRPVPGCLFCRHSQTATFEAQVGRCFAPDKQVPRLPAAAELQATA